MAQLEVAIRAEDVSALAAALDGGADPNTLAATLPMDWMGTGNAFQLAVALGKTQAATIVLERMARGGLPLAKAVGGTTSEGVPALCLGN